MSACVMQMYACTLFRMLATFVCLCVCAHARKKHAHTRTPARTHAPTQKTRARARAHVQSAWESAGHRRENLRGSQHSYDCWVRSFRNPHPPMIRSDQIRSWWDRDEIAISSRCHHDLIWSDLIMGGCGLRKERTQQSYAALGRCSHCAFWRETVLGVLYPHATAKCWLMLYKQRLFYINCRAVTTASFGMWQNERL